MTASGSGIAAGDSGMAAVGSGMVAGSSGIAARSSMSETEITYHVILICKDKAYTKNYRTVYLLNQSNVVCFNKHQIFPISILGLSYQGNKLYLLRYLLDA